MHSILQVFRVRLILQVFKGKDSPLTLDWDRVRVFDREVGQMFVNLAKTSREARVRGHTNTCLINMAPVGQSYTYGPCRSVCYVWSL